jgi:transposase-like protein
MNQKQTLQGLKGKRGRQFECDLSFMHLVVREYLMGKFSMLQIAQKHNITRNRLLGWVKRFSADLSEEITTIPILTEKESQDQQLLKKQNEELAQKLAQAQMKITGLELMIDIAEEQLNIDIRKKSGTKQSNG